MGRFNKTMMNKVFLAAPKVPGRDPNRWRFDVNGREVFFDHRGKTGITGWQADHIKPSSDDGPDTFENAQLLQGMANKRKGDSILTPGELWLKRSSIKLTPSQMDLTELSVLGTTHDEHGRVISKIQSVEEVWAGLRKHNASCTPAAIGSQRCLTNGLALAALGRAIKVHGPGFITGDSKEEDACNEDVVEEED